MSKVIYQYVKVDDSVPIQKLPIIEQFRLLLKHFTFSEASLLTQDDEVTQQRLALKADLESFLYSATEPLRSGKNKTVYVLLPVMFAPVLEEVLQSESISRFFRCFVAKPALALRVDVDVMVKLQVKED